MEHPCTIGVVTEEDLDDLLALMRAYCHFYGAAPPDEALLALARALVLDSEREGLQLIARDQTDAAIGFATMFWTWSTTDAARIGVMNDLYVIPEARGSGVADALISACVKCCRRRGVVSMHWQTAPENLRAQAVYERVGGKRESWVDYSLSVSGC